MTSELSNLYSFFLAILKVLWTTKLGLGIAFVCWYELVYLRRSGKVVPIRKPSGPVPRRRADRKAA